MKNLRLENIIIVLSILAVTAFTAFRCSTEKSEVKAPDSELVKCLEKKILSGEIHQEELDPTFFALESNFSTNVRWVDDSTIVINIVTDSYSETPSTTAHVTLIDQEIQLTKHESDRIVEITNKQRDKLAKIQEKLEKKKQYSLRIELLKNCK